MSIQTLELTPGPGFDPNNSQHVSRVIEKVVAAEQAKANAAATAAGDEVAGEMGDNRADWKVLSFDAKTGKLTIYRQAAVTQIDVDKRGTRTVSIPAGTKASEAEGIAARLQEMHEGYYLSEFNPHLGKAQLTKMSLEEFRVREAIATAISVKPWDLKVKGSKAAGYEVKLPASFMPSKHDEKIQEVAETVAGQFGWYWESDPVTLKGNIVPSVPPTFPGSIPFPMDLLPKPTPGLVNPIPFGMALAARGDEDNSVCWLRLEDAPHSQVGGTSGSGKSVTLNSIVAGALAAGAELAIVDVPAKAVDYELWRPFVRKNGWGCESFEENAVMLQELYNEGNRRAEVLKRYGAKKLTELPPDILATMPPVLIVCDEVTGLFAPANEKPPRGLASDHPLVIEAASKATASAMIASYIAKIAAEQRFVGFKLILATQVASTATGITTALRTNLGNKMLLGARATDGNRKLILADVTAAPEIPKHIQQAEGLVPKGVGVAELEAQRPMVFKSFYASEKDFIKQLNARGITGLPLTQLDATRPDPAKVKEAFPEAARMAEEQRLDEKKFGAGPQAVQDWQLDPTTGEKLNPRQAANRARHLLTVQAKAAKAAEA
jgi:hypothetical protein